MDLSFNDARRMEFSGTTGRQHSASRHSGCEMPSALGGTASAIEAGHAIAARIA
ncbi:hypothetical protein [Comamonas badia]|uniref:hypothetical protein n=1 Tax=Comamonas badia TaxID=265291 RepID=UPI0012EC9623|nr:hypothetical protein [Comamonas badia]